MTSLGGIVKYISVLGVYFSGGLTPLIYHTVDTSTSGGGNP
ncbi:hypothetical protein [Candidatus Mycoplasma haematominutum]|uniref:Uncharacterized protein n=1 Tax=Candidatus Mycoplasma haematominutum 'Birmingham 1' TaxID=1116213 RepID=G8C3E1_9MOLU|nr:hypothetical protein [Candidatus Mycoplasma haematominutum]CCE66839.1 hypothetical protein MHM_03210 [Candidatus Mycoplasma haematominutum 'Birmingham 1']